MHTTITEPEFARLALVRGGQLAWFLGAGASASAGVPTAWHMITAFKASLYASAHKLDRRDIDLDDDLWIDRINRYFDGANGFPATGDPREYEAAFIAMYPAAEDRRRYIAEAVERGTPSYGQRVFGAALATGLTPLAFTTNFDSLIEQSAAWANDHLPVDQRHPLRVGALTNSDVAQRTLAQSDWPLLVKLHGDYQSDTIMNTSDELQTQDVVLRTVLTESLRRFGLVVAGYSGRDDSIMDALEEVLAAPNPYPNGLFWVVRSSTQLLPRVTAFLAAAESAGVSTRLVASETFDEMLGELARQASFPAAIADGIRGTAPTERVADVQIPGTEVADHPVLRFNALPVISMPPTVLTVTTSISNHDLRAKLKDRRGRVDVISNGTAIVALGSDVDLRQALGDVVLGTRPADPGTDTVVRGLLLNSLTRALSHDRPLRPVFRRSSNELVIRDSSNLRDSAAKAKADRALSELRSVYGADLFGMLAKYDGRRYAEGLHVRLEERLSTWWLIFEPFTWVEPHPDRLRPDPIAPWIRERWFQRRNQKWAEMVAVWASVLAPTPQTTVSAWKGGDSTRFVIGGTTAWSVPGQEGVA